MRLSVISNTLISAAVLLGATLAISGCSDGPPDITDEQILNFLGERNVFADASLPLTISVGTIECVELLSGISDEVVQDMPAEFLGMFKTDCREQFDRLVKNEERNTFGFQLKHFENKRFAERLIELKSTTDAAYEKALKELRARREAARKAAREEERIRMEKRRALEEEKRAREIERRRVETEAELRKLTARYTAFVADLDKHALTIDNGCAEWAKLQSSFSGNRGARWLLRRPSLCTSRRDQMEKAARNGLKHLQAAKLKRSGSRYTFDRPFQGIYREEWFAKELEVLQESLEDIRAEHATL